MKAKQLPRVYGLVGYDLFPYFLVHEGILMPNGWINTGWGQFKPLAVLGVQQAAQLEAALNRLKRDREAADKKQRIQSLRDLNNVLRSLGLENHMKDIPR